MNIAKTCTLSTSHALNLRGPCRPGEQRQRVPRVTESWRSMTATADGCVKTLLRRVRRSRLNLSRGGRGGDRRPDSSSPCIGVFEPVSLVRNACSPTALNPFISERLRFFLSSYRRDGFIIGPRKRQIRVIAATWLISRN